MKRKAKLQSVHDFVSELGSHSIYDDAKLAADFKAKTGREPCWASQTVAQTQREIKARGVGGHVNGPAQQKVTSGYVVAAACAQVYAKSTAHRQFMGRGTIFFSALQALKDANV